MDSALAGAVLAAACGFGAAVWTITVWFTRKANIWHATLYGMVAICYAAVGGLVTFRIIGRPFTPTPIFTIVLLSVIFVVPAAIQLAGHLAARRMIDERINGHD